MRKFRLLLLSGLFFGFASHVGPNKYDPKICNDSQKGPPGIKTIDLAYLNGADPTIANDGTRNFIISTMQMGKGNIDELSEEFENRTTAQINILYQRIG